MDIGIRLAKKMISKVFSSGKTKAPIFLHASPGVGKSQIIEQLTVEHDLQMVDLRLASMESTDLCGIPFIVDGKQVFSVPTWFPTDPNSKGVIFLDELSNASTAVQHVAYRLILDRQIQDGVSLPDGWFIIAAGNHKKDKTGVKGIVPALANRFSMHLSITANLNDFNQYAIETKLETSIVGFLNFASSYLYKFDPTKNTEMAFPTPRSWVAAADLLTYDFQDDEILIALAGCVGEGAANEFMAFRKYYSKLPNFQAIMDGKETYKIPTTDMGLVFAVSSTLIFLILENYKTDSKLANLSPILDQLADDHLMMIFKTLSQTRNSDMILQVLAHLGTSYERVSKHLNK